MVPRLWRSRFSRFAVTSIDRRANTPSTPLSLDPLPSPSTPFSLPFPSPPQFLLSPSPCTWPTHCISLAMYRCWVANVPRKRKIRNFQANVSAHVELCFTCSICSKDHLRRTATTSCSKLRSWVSSITWMLSDWRAWSPNVSMSDRPHLFVSTCTILCHPTLKVKSLLK